MKKHSELKIVYPEKFEYELEWFEALKKASGPLNEKLILHCDKWRLNDTKDGNKNTGCITSTTSHILQLFKQFGIDTDETLTERILFYFFNTPPNYYSIKEFIINELDKVKLDYETVK